MVADLIPTGDLGQEPPLPAFRHFGDPARVTGAVPAPAMAATPVN